MLKSNILSIYSEKKEEFIHSSVTCHLRKLMAFLTSNAIFTLTLHLQRLNIDTLVTNKASTGNASVWLAETFLTGP